MKQTSRSIPPCGRGHGTTRLPGRFPAWLAADVRFGSLSKCSIDRQYHKKVELLGRSEHPLSGVTPKRPNPHFSAVRLGSSPQYCSEQSNHVGHKQWQRSQLYHTLWRTTRLAQWHESLFHKVLSANAIVSRSRGIRANPNTHCRPLLRRCKKFIVF
jgi:hypothetical protein